MSVSQPNPLTTLLTGLVASIRVEAEATQAHLRVQLVSIKQQLEALEQLLASERADLLKAQSFAKSLEQGLEDAHAQAKEAAEEATTRQTGLDLKCTQLSAAVLQLEGALVDKGLQLDQER